MLYPGLMGWYSPRTMQQSKTARDRLQQTADEAGDVLSAIDGSLLDDTADTVCDALEGALYAYDLADGTSDLIPDALYYRREDHWMVHAMRWRPPPGPGEPDPFADSEETEKFLTRIKVPYHQRDPSDRPRPSVRDWTRGYLHHRPPVIRPPQNPFEYAMAAERMAERNMFTYRAEERMAFVIDTPTFFVSYGGDVNRPQPQPRWATLGRRLRLIEEGLQEFGRSVTHAFRPLVEALDRLLPSEPPEDDRERALYLRGTRNTGPDHEPFRHRGGITRDRVPEQPRRRVRERPQRPTRDRG